jgi:polyisoprenyl-phosphate glycosyltransferase
MPVTQPLREVVAPGGASPARPLLSVVVPAHDEAAVIRRTLGRLAAVAEELDGAVEVIVVSDGSRDDTFEIARRELERGLAGTVIELVTNAGSHAAIRCGLRYASGDYVAIMAADGQDPPEALPAMLREFRPQVDVVWGRRRDRSADRRGARMLAAAYYRLFRVLTGLDYPPAGLDFLVARRRVVLALLEHSHRNASLFLTVFNLGFAQAYVDYDRGVRAGGSSSWTLRKRVKLALDMLTGCSPAPLRIVAGAGMTVSLAGVALGLVTLAGGAGATGWAALMVVTSITSGLVMLAVGLMGEYVWRTLDEVRAGPPFIEARHAHVSCETLRREDVQ